MMLRPSLTLACILLLKCSSGYLLYFKPEVVGVIRVPNLNESSGIDSSKLHRDVLYLVSDNEADHKGRIYAFSKKNASLLAVWVIPQVRHCDWEDLTVGPGPVKGKSYIYIGDVGGNTDYKCFVIYRLLEPDVIRNGSLPFDAYLRYTWPENNCETIMVDKHGVVHLVSKVREKGQPKLYHIPPNAVWRKTRAELKIKVRLAGGSNVNGIFQQCANGTNVTLCKGPTAGDISDTGKHVIIKDYNLVYHWYNDDDVDLSTLLQREPWVIHSYIEEKQGEGICWGDKKAQSFYTHGEKQFQPLYRYTLTYDPVFAGRGDASIHRNLRKSTKNVIISLWLIYVFKFYLLMTRT